MSIYSCDPDLGVYTPDDCPGPSGRLRNAAVIRCDKFESFVDFTDLAEWQAAILAGTIFLFPNTRGEWPEPSAVTVEGRGNQSTRRINTEQTAKFVTGGITEANRDFFNALNQSSAWYLVGQIGEGTGALHFLSTSTVDFNGSAPVEDSLDSEVEWNINATWKHIDIPDIKAVPTGLYTT